MLLAALAASGAAGLIYQICWIRSASLVVGSTTQALGIVLATFFGGLAVGSAVFGRVAVRTGRPPDCGTFASGVVGAPAIAWTWRKGWTK